jgi:hypothetical protein
VWGKSKHDPLRGLPCIHGFLLTLIGVVMFCWWLHGALGILAILALAFAAYRLIFGGRK